VPRRESEYLVVQCLCLSKVAVMSDSNITCTISRSSNRRFGDKVGTSLVRLSLALRIVQGIYRNLFVLYSFLCEVSRTCILESECPLPTF